MQFINTDGLSFIGPGSEWFWTAISGIVLAITFVAIYRQLATARSANAFEQIDRITNNWESERALRQRLAVCLSIRAGVDREDVPEGAAAYISDFWEHCAGLIRAGHIDRQLFHADFGQIVRYWWQILAPNTYRYRRETGDTSGRDFEWLARTMAEMDRRAGRPDVFDEEHLLSTLDRRIQSLEDKVHLAEDLRSVPRARRSAGA